jgi:glycosyltransferase involved in cell wall biosynthesis
MVLPDAARLPQRTRTLKFLYHHRTRSGDGQSIHIDNLIGALRQAGHTVAVVAPERIPATAEPLKKKLLPKFLYEALEFCYSFVELWQLARAVRRHRPDVLYQRANVFTLSGVWLSRIFHLPYLLEVNAPLSSERSRFGGLAWPRFAAWTEHSAWRAANFVLPVTAVLARELESKGVLSERIVVIPNGVDLARLKPKERGEAKRRLGLTAGVVLGFVGFVREWHGLDHIVELLSSEPQLATAQFLVVGDGPACPSLRARAAQLGIAERVIITGVIAHDQLQDYLSAVDIALQPEVTPYASPLKLFEYMALGRAIVAPDVENIREILEHDIDSLLFPPGDIDALSDAIRRLASDGDLCSRLGTAAARKIRSRNLTWQGNAERVAALAAGLVRHD